jgi:hypothetical protein
LVQSTASITPLLSESEVSDTCAVQTTTTSFSPQNNFTDSDDNQKEFELVFSSTNFGIDFDTTMDVGVELQLSH